MTSTSERALSASRSQVRETPEHERALSEEFRILALQYADAEAAANYMEELKTTTLEKLKTALMAEQGEMADNRAERIVKASQSWEDYLKAMCGHRAKATKLKLQLEYVRMRHSEWQSKEANARVERRL